MSPEMSHVLRVPRGILSDVFCPVSMCLTLTHKLANARTVSRFIFVILEPTSLPGQ